MSRRSWSATLLAHGPPIVLVIIAGLLALPGAAHQGTADGRGSAAASPAAVALRPAGPRVLPAPALATPAARTAAARVTGPRRPPRFTATGRLVVVPGQGQVVGRGPVRRYTVEVEAGLPENAASFAASVERTLAASQGWAATLGLAFQRVESGPAAFRVTLVSPGTTDRLCRPLRTGGIFSCYMGGRAVLNVGRWRVPPRAFRGAVTPYRQYMINHEIGHALGFGHRECPAPGRPAPVMMQQTKGVGACRPNPWPGIR